MSKLSLSLRGETLYVRYYHLDSKILINTQLLIKQEHWDSKNKTLLKSLPDHKKAMFFIEGIFQKIRKIVLDLIASGETPYPYLVSQHYFGELKPKANFWDFLHTFIEEGKNNKRPATVTNYLKLKRILIEFEQLDGIKISFESIDLNFYHRLQLFFSKRKLSDNYFGSIIKLLKTVLTDATERGLNQNLAYKQRKFKIIHNSTDAIYLNEQELTILFELDLYRNPTLEIVRDWFILGAYTALRYSDLSTLERENFVEDIIKKQNLKTGKWVSLPLHPYVQQILSKYNGLPKLIDHSDFNKRIKKVAKLGGLDSSFTCVRIIANKRVKTVYKKHEAISSHTMRRSFATNLHKRGFPLTYIMTFTGHSSIGSLVKYLKGDFDEATNLLRDFWRKPELGSVSS
jgi:integrase